MLRHRFLHNKKTAIQLRPSQQVLLPIGVFSFSYDYSSLLDRSAVFLALPVRCIGHETSSNAQEHSSEREKLHSFQMETILSDSRKQMLDEEWSQ